MPNRSVNFLAAVFAAVLAGANLATVTDIRAQAAADTCLTAPKDKTPAGGHWRYRLERGTGRQCWYLKDENDKTARAATQEPVDLSPEAAAAESPSTAADPVPPQPRPVRKSISNAHAELTPPRARAEQEANAPVEPQTTGTATMARIPNRPAAIAPDIAAPSSTAPTRWLDTTGMNSSGGFGLAAAEPAASPPETEQPALQPATPPVAPAVAADSSMAKQSASMQMLFLVMAGALAMAGITASLLFRFGRRARKRRLERRRDRRAIWDSVDKKRPSHARRPSPSMRPDEAAPAWRRDAAQDPRAADDPQRRVTEMLSRLARSAQH
jgi:hypothetical protein